MAHKVFLVIPCNNYLPRIHQSDFCDPQPTRTQKPASQKRSKMNGSLVMVAAAARGGSSGNWNFAKLQWWMLLVGAFSFFSPACACAGTLLYSMYDVSREYVLAHARMLVFARFSKPNKSVVCAMVTRVFLPQRLRLCACSKPSSIPWMKSGGRSGVIGCRTPREMATTSPQLPPLSVDSSRRLQVQVLYVPARSEPRA